MVNLRGAGAAPRRALSLVAASLLLSGCDTVDEWLRGKGAREDSAPIPVSSTVVERYLDEMYRLVEGDPAVQAEIYADALSAAELTPGPETRLRYALVLATPGHNGNDDVLARNLLREILVEPVLLTSAELSLATIHLQEVEQRIVLVEESRKIHAEHSRETDARRQSLERRVRNVEAENVALRESLSEAESKLEAITSIERSIREQSEND